MTLRAMTSAAIAAVLLAAVAGCGAKSASSTSDVELAYSVVGERGIFLIDREGKHHQRLPTPAFAESHPDWTGDTLPEWSPDGSRLAFVRESANDKLPDWVYVVGRDGKHARKLVRGESAVWLPDGSGLLVQRSSNIFVVTLEGKSRLLAHGTGAIADSAILSPDGAMVAYLRTAYTKAGYSTVTIYVTVTRGGLERKILVVRDSDVDALAWSSDGQALYGVWYLHYTGEEPENAAATLLEVTLSGSSRVVATEVNPDSGIDVSPSGDQVAFVGRRGLEVVDVETGKRRAVVAGDPNEFVDPQWSPDGSTLAYLASTSPDLDLVPTMLETVRADGSLRRQVSAHPGADELVESFSWRPASDAE